VNTVDLTALFIQQMTTLFQSYSFIMIVLLLMLLVKSDAETHQWNLREMHLLGGALGLLVYYSYTGAMTFWL
jgi:uncharacterized membrane protein YsdA (DUF1294 family)